MKLLVNLKSIIKIWYLLKSLNLHFLWTRVEKIEKAQNIPEYNLLKYQKTFISSSLMREGSTLRTRWYRLSAISMVTEVVDCSASCAIVAMRCWWGCSKSWRSRTRRSLRKEWFSLRWQSWNRRWEGALSKMKMLCVPAAENNLSKKR